MRGAVLSVIALLFAAAPAAAAESGIGARFSARQNQGDMKDPYPFGIGVGMEANYQPGLIGLVWSLDFTRNYGDTRFPQATANYVVLVDAELAARFKRAFSRTGFFTAQLGYDVVRSGDTIGPSQARAFYGPSVGVGFGGQVGNMNVGFAATEVFAGSVTGVTVIVFVGVTSR